MEALDVKVDINRNKPIWRLSLQRKFSVPKMFIELNDWDHLHEVMGLWFDALSVQKRTVKIENVCHY